MTDPKSPQPQADGAGGRKPPQPPISIADAGEPSRRKAALLAAFRAKAKQRRSI